MSWTENLNSVSAHWSESIWRATWQGALLIGVVWLIAKLWRSMPNGLRCTFWVLALGRLLIGFTPLSLKIACLPADQPQFSPVVPQFTPYEGTPIFTRLLPVSHPVSMSLSSWLMFSWLLGVAIFASVTAVRVARTYRLANRATNCQDPDLIHQAHQLRLSLGIRTNPRLLVSRETESVLTVGALRPSILLSESAVEACSDAEKQIVIAHELCHIARKDVWLGIVPQMAQTLFFFHPLAWLAAREFDFAREAACDELAMECLGIGSQSYGRLLLKLGTGNRTASTLTSPGVSSHFQLLRRRIAMLEQTSNRKRLLTGRRTLALICLAGIFGVVPMSLGQAQQTFDNAEVISKVPLPPAISVAPAKKASSTRTLTSSKNTVKGTKPIASSVKQTPMKVALGKAIGKPLVISQPIEIRNTPKLSLPKAAPLTVEHENMRLWVSQLRYANADATAQLLNSLYPSSGNSGIRFADDHRTNSILVSAPESKLDEIRNVIVQIDIPGKSGDEGMPALELKVVHLVYADADRVAQTLKSMYNPTSIAADSNSNSIVVRSTPAIVGEVLKLLRELDIKK